MSDPAPSQPMPHDEKVFLVCLVVSLFIPIPGLTCLVVFLGLVHFLLKLLS